jgi:hypothetical protein
MKNTNTKIIHRLFAQDDKEAVGHTMGLEEEQANFLSNLQIGRAVVFNGNWPKAIQVQITQKYRTDTTPDPKESENIRNAALEFYASDWKRGVFAMSHLLNKPDVSTLECAAERLRRLIRLFRSDKISVQLQWDPSILPTLCGTYGMDVVEALLFDAESTKELFSYVTDNKDAPKKWKLDVLLSKINEFGYSAVWQVLASRGFALRTVKAAEEAFEKLLRAFAKTGKKELDDVEGKISPKAFELNNLRRALTAILKK